MEMSFKILKQTSVIVFCLNKLPSQGNFECVKELSTFTYEGSTENVLVTHVTSPHSFVVQLQSRQSKIATMLYAIQRWCNNAQNRNTVLDAVDVGWYNKKVGLSLYRNRWSCYFILASVPKSVFKQSPIALVIKPACVLYILWAQCLAIAYFVFNGLIYIRVSFWQNVNL